MFTGIVEETGEVLSLEKREAAWRLHLRAGVVLEGLRDGDSVAVNGCCLTAVEAGEGTVSFDLLEETLKKTSFRAVEECRAQGLPAVVNLERSLRADSRLGGHFVSGHVDATGTVDRFEPRGDDHYLRVRFPREFAQYLVYKGSIALDGISLTVAEVEDDTFAVWLIPHTLAVTNLRERSAGDPLNLEFDLLAKYVERQLALREGGKTAW